MDPISTPEQARDAVQRLAADVRGAGDKISGVEAKIAELERAHQVTAQALRDQAETAWNRPTGGSVRDFLVDPMDPAKGLRMVDCEGEINLPELGIRASGVALPGFLTSRPISDEHAAFQRAIEVAQWQRQVTGGRVPRQALANVALAFRALDPQTRQIVAQTASTGRNAAVWGEHHARAFGDSSGNGAEWIPDTFINTLYRPFEVMTSEIDGVFDVINVPGPVVIPSLQSGGLRPYMGDKLPYEDPAAITSSTYTTSNETIDVGAMMVRYVMNATAAEDAAPFVAQAAQMEIMRALRDGRADRWINGDSAGTHQDAIASWNIRSRWGATGLGGSADHRRSAVAGARAHAFDASCTSDQSATSTGLVDVILNVAALLGENSADELVVYLSPEKVLALLKDSRVVTVDAFGADASIKVGIRGLGTIFGTFRVIMTRWLEPTMAATGLYTGSSTYDSIVVVSRSAWKLVNRRGPVATVEPERKRNAIHLIGSSRQDMYRPGYSATAKIAAVGFKI
ncbi:MAG: hypothetical protein ACO3GM_00790 [Candidatus Limnocylindrus sp.]